ncbi:class I SAM-dependent methyltransferase [Flavivirga aquimarina]|uniref:Class I SAM-dependent methyltransferase n=1 Tax=Flavivirga aquimarina TaxID=2027862 RepID=A0ABT8WBN8_9FLAO|nr:class I SAM-dependent methyltransferase [Flavivirga aquimarina]MDO5970566.1 class I SAM-dependent methyltransferase [Flavivirga aquimarina]
MKSMLSNIKKRVKKMLFSDRKKNAKTPFKGSKLYWENRYTLNGNSGPGSYGRLAIFKAKILNAFVQENKINTVIEFGCGDGNQLELATYPSYIGFDVSEKAISICKSKFKEDDSKSFKLYSKNYIKEQETIKGELAMSLDVIYHLVEDDIFFDHMENLFRASSKYVIIYSSNYNDNTMSSHVRCRKFSDWIDENLKHDWVLIDKIENDYSFNPEEPKDTSMSDFYIYEKKA